MALIADLVGDASTLLECAKLGISAAISVLWIMRQQMGSLPCMEGTLVLNGFEVDRRLASLMRHADWQGKRTSEAWMSKFPAHPEASRTIPFVDLIGPDHAILENGNLRDPDLDVLWDVPNADFPPGNYDPENGYLIGYTDYCDSAIIVDLRPENGPRVIYENLCSKGALYTTAFDTLEELIDFYIEQHGH